MYNCNFYLLYPIVVSRSYLFGGGGDRGAFRFKWVINALIIIWLTYLLCTVAATYFQVRFWYCKFLFSNPVSELWGSHYDSMIKFVLLN